MLNEFAICFDVVVVFILNVIVLLCVNVFFNVFFVGDTIYCLPEYVCIVIP